MWSLGAWRTIRSGTAALLSNPAEVKEALHLHCRPMMCGCLELLADVHQEHSSGRRATTADSQAGTPMGREAKVRDRGVVTGLARVFKDGQ